MCLLLEHQNLSQTSEKMGYFDRVQFLYAEGPFFNFYFLSLSLFFFFFFYSALRALIALRVTCSVPARIWLAVIDFQNGKQQSRSGSDTVRSEEIVYSRFIKIPLG